MKMAHENAVYIREGSQKHSPVYIFNGKLYFFERKLHHHGLHSIICSRFKLVYFLVKVYSLCMIVSYQTMEISF